MKLTDEQIKLVCRTGMWDDSWQSVQFARAIEAEVLRLNGVGGDAWRTEAAKWLRRKADEQQRTNELYPAHVKAYPSWEQRVLWLTWLAQDLEAEQEAAPHGLEPWQVDTQPQQAAPGAVLEGWQLVPAIPTDTMLVRGSCAMCGDRSEIEKLHRGWNAMLSAAPKPQGE